ncbi:MAG TPA: ATP-binding cassette domain-containing protein [Kofleriaceae bacterium]|nr:ATP-binding cassette domain-containing protein [Kofleriaceae bacterium]
MERAADGALEVAVSLARGGGADRFSLDVSFRVPPGITILFGPSGTGKSTTLQAIAGLVRPERGRIALGGETWFDGERGLERPTRLRGIAYLFQSLALFPHLTAIGNVCYGIPRSVPRPERHRRAAALLERLGVAHLARRRPRTYSGGEAQRVALARALAMEPRVLLLDEPFSALDRDLRAQLSADVRALVSERRLPTLQVTHHLGEARAMGDQVLRMSAGRIVEAGTTAILDGAD